MRVGAKTPCQTGDEIAVEAVATVENTHLMAAGGQDRAIDLEGSCDSLPIVVGPLPGICFNMFMIDAPLLAQPLLNADVLHLISSVDYAMVIGKSADGWLKIDLSVGNIGQNIEGWVEGMNANFNGPCADLPILEP